MKIRELLFVCLILYILPSSLLGGNLPCSATALPNNMTEFEYYDNSSNTASGVPVPPCGNYVSKDIWFSVQATANGKLYIVTIPGTMTNAAMAIYEGSCANPQLIRCVENDLCGNTEMPITSFNDLIPNATYLIRIWAEFGGPNGTFGIRISETDLAPPQFDLTNNATYISEECIQLTANSPSQLGCAWYPEQIDFTVPFSHTMSMNFGGSDAGADGICLVYQSNSNSICGQGGGQIGAGTIPNSFIVEFDTYVNATPFNDPPFDHSSVNVNGDMDHVNSISAPVSINGGNVETNQYYDVTFNWEPAGNNYEVYFDGTMIHSGSYDVVANCFGGNSMAYWGYAASTGGAWNTQTICPGAETYPHGVEVMDSVEICDGESYYVGGGNQTTSGVYTDILVAPNGCDSVVHTNLEVLPNSSFDMPLQVVCEGDCIDVAGTQICNAGLYEVHTSSGNGCDSVINVELMVLNPIAVAFPPSLPISCNIVAVQIDGSLSTSGPGVVYSWTGPNGFTSTDQSPWVFEGGIYTLVVIQSFGGVDCISNSFNVQIIEDTEEPVADAGDDIMLSCDGGVIYLDGTGSSTGTNIIYSWTGPNGFQSSEQNPPISESGDYMLLVLDNSNGCFSTDFVEVSGDIVLPLAEASGGNINCSQNSIQLAGSSDLPDVSFFWTGPNGFESTEQNPVVSEDGVYSLTVITDAGCASSDTALVSGNFEQPVLSAEGDTITCDNNTGQLSADSNIPGTSYNWSGPNGYTSTLQNPTAGISGQYTLIGIAPNGCSDTVSTLIISDANIPQVQLQDDTLNCIVNEVNLNLQYSGDQLSFNWEGPNGFASNDTTPLIAVAGTYFVTVTADNGCQVIDSLVINEDTLIPSISLSADTISCISGNAQINSMISDSLAQINWSGPDNFMSNQANPLVSKAGIYILEVISANGCSKTDSIEIFQDVNVPDLNLQIDTLTCLKDSVIVLASSNDPNVQYSWEGPNGFSSSIPDPVIYIPGSYTISIIADNGCQAVQEFDIPADTLAPLVDLSADTINCINAEVNIINADHQSDYIYNWTGPGGISYNDESPAVSVPGLYILEIQLQNGCVTNGQIEIGIDTISPDIQLSILDSLDCSNPVGKISVNSDLPDVSILWTGPDGFISSVSEPLIDVPGIYEVVVTNVNGCVASGTLNIPADTLAPVFEVFDDIIDCNFPSISLMYQGDGTETSIEWTGPNGFNSQLPSPVITEGGSYTLELTNSAGCKTQHSLTIEVDTISPAFQLQGDDIGCDETETDIQIVNGENEWQFNWTGPLNFNSADQEITVQNPGQYMVTATDPENGCQTFENIYIDQILGPESVNFGLSQPDCFNPNTGIIEIYSVNGGDPNVTFALDQQANYTSSLIFDDLAPGIHHLYVIDGNGCKTDTIFTIQDFDNLSIDLQNFIQLSFGEQYQLQVITNIPGGEIVSVVWTPSEGLSCSDCLNPILTGGLHTEYSVTITDINGCEISTSTTIRLLETEIYAPNIFSPNNDGVNDYFTFFGNPDQISGILDLHIFDRWGNLVFEKGELEINNPSEGWNGVFRDKPAIPGVYTYFAIIKFPDGNSTPVKGDVSLIR